MNRNNNSYGNINLSMGTLGGGGGASNAGGGNLLGTGAGMGYVGAPTPGPNTNQLDVSNVFNKNTIVKLQTRKLHLEYWLRTTQQANSVVFVSFSIQFI
jgi:hypothetical protein